MSFSDWMFVSAGIAVAIAVLAIPWGAFTRTKEAEVEPIGDGALLDHPWVHEGVAVVAPTVRSSFGCAGNEPEPMGM